MVSNKVLRRSSVVFASLIRHHLFQNVGEAPALVQQAGATEQRAHLIPAGHAHRPPGARIVSVVTVVPVMDLAGAAPHFAALALAQFGVPGGGVNPALSSRSVLAQIRD